MSRRRTVSICLCTYNGERFLPQLLASLSEQSRSPDELVVCDDLSTDATPLILREFVNSASFPVRLVINERRLGIIHNFEQAVSLAQEGLLLICDQDDVWHWEKIAVMADIFERWPQLSGAFHDSDLIDAEGGKLPGTLWDLVCLSKSARSQLHDGRGLSYLIRHPRIAGHTLAVPSAARSLLLPFSPRSGYDNWICRLLSARGQLFPMEQILVSHRLHPENAVGVWRSKTVAERLHRSSLVSSSYLAEADGLRDLASRLEACLPSAMTAKVEHDLKGKVAHMERRAALQNRALRSPLMRARACVGVVHETGTLGYHRYSNGFSSAAFDMVSSCRRR